MHFAVGTQSSAHDRHADTHVSYFGHAAIQFAQQIENEMCMKNSLDNCMQVFLNFGSALRHAGG